MSARIIKEYCPKCAILMRTYTSGAGTDDEGIIAALEGTTAGIVYFEGTAIPVVKKRYGGEHRGCIPRTTESIARWRKVK